MIVLHLLQLNGSVNFYRKWKLISSEVGVKLKNRKNSKFSKKIKLWSKFTTYVRPVRPPVGAPAEDLPKCFRCMRYVTERWRDLMVRDATDCESVSTSHLMSVLLLARVIMERRRRVALCGWTPHSPTCRAWVWSAPWVSLLHWSGHFVFSPVERDISRTTLHLASVMLTPISVIMYASAV